MRVLKAILYPILLFVIIMAGVTAIIYLIIKIGGL